jgi:hypothetical protein
MNTEPRRPGTEYRTDSLAAGIKATGGEGDGGPRDGTLCGPPAAASMPPASGEHEGSEVCGPRGLPAPGWPPSPDRGGGAGAGPPFDGKPCPMCPVEVRGLHGAAHNALNRFDDIFNRGYDGDSAWFKLREKMEELRAAVEKIRPLSDAHFADRRHSHGE